MREPNVAGCVWALVVNALVDGEVVPEEREAVRAHLARCAACAAQFGNALQLGALARQATPAPATEAPVPLPADVAALVEEARRIDKAATPGPWIPFPNSRVLSVGTKADNDAIVHWSGFDSARASLSERRRNRDFIARARTLVPEMSAALSSQARDLDAALTDIEAADAALDFAGEPKRADHNVLARVVDALFDKADLRGALRLAMMIGLAEATGLRARLVEVEGERDEYRDALRTICNVVHNDDDADDLDGPALCTEAIAAAEHADEQHGYAVLARDKAEDERDAAISSVKTANEAMLRVTNADTAIREHKAKCDACRRLRQCAAVEALLLAEEGAIDALRALAVPRG